MKIKRLFAKDIRATVKQLREEQGSDAVILSNRQMAHGIEISAAAGVDYEEGQFLDLLSENTRSRRPETSGESEQAVQHTQSAGLHQMAHPNPVRVVAVTSGEGGVGKTSVSVNLAVAIAKKGKQVMLMDADLGLANVDVMLGLYAPYNLSHVLQGQLKLEEVIVTGPCGIRIVPAASGIKKMAELKPAENAALVNAFNELSEPLDVLLIDTSSGISDSVISFSRTAQDVIVVVCDEPASITNAYALIKLLSQDFGVDRFRILSSMVADLHQGLELFRKVSNVTDRFLDICIDFMGVVPADDFLRKAVQRQRSVVEDFPDSKSARAFRSMAKDMEYWLRTNQTNGQQQFFQEPLIQTGVGVDVTQGGVTV